MSIKPETFLCAVFETVFKSPRSLSPQVRRRVTQRYRLVKLLIVSYSAGFGVILTIMGSLLRVVPAPCC